MFKAFFFFFFSFNLMVGCTARVRVDKHGCTWQGIGMLGWDVTEGTTKAIKDGFPHDEVWLIWLLARLEATRLVWFLKCFLSFFLSSFILKNKMIDLMMVIKRINSMTVFRNFQKTIIESIDYMVRLQCWFKKKKKNLITYAQ